jgi:hypothetical protein
MRVALKVALYLLGLGAMFVVAAGIGRVSEPFFTPGTQSHLAMAGPTEEHTSRPEPEPEASPRAQATRHAGKPEHEQPAAPAGLQVAQDGYALRITSTAPQVRRPSRVSFQISGPDGRPVREYAPTHEKRMHLIVVRRDLTYYQHAHPVLGPDGTWNAVLTFARAGTYRVFADFQPRRLDRRLTLGADLIVPGNQLPRALPPESRVTGVRGYAIELAGTLRPGRPSRLAFTVTRNGRPVTDLQPYLGASGHLIVLRAGDLAYLHAHPEPGRALAFDAEAPSAGTYRLFLDFRHQGLVRTAEFTVTAR